MQPAPLEGPGKDLDARSTLWREIVQRHPEPIVIVNDRGMIRFANDAAYRVFDVPRGELTGSLIDPNTSQQDPVQVGILRPDARPLNVEIRREPLASGEEPLYALLLDEHAPEPPSKPTPEDPLDEERPSPLDEDDDLPSVREEPLGFSSPLDEARNTLATPLDQLLGTRPMRLRLPHTHRTSIRHRAHRRHTLDPNTRRR